MTTLPPRYSGARRLGDGGMAEVFAAFDETLRRDVAVKILAERFQDDDTMRERFLREAVVAASLGRHPHVMGVHDVGEWNGRPYIVMELATGGSLAEVVERGVPDTEQALAWLAEAADALDAAHERGIVHRDVKPANLLLDEYGAVRVADFGIARTEERTLTSAGEVLGTAGYLAPEQARGERCTPATDRFALALVARELLTGRRDGAVPAATRTIFERALATDPERRYPSASAFVEALADTFPERTRTLRTVRVRADGGSRPASLHRARRPLRRVIRVTAVALAALALAALAAAVTHVYTLADAERAARAAPRPTTCTVSPVDHDANVVANGVGAARFCKRLAARFTSGDEFWSRRIGRDLLAPDHGTPELSVVCRFRSGRVRVIVYDSGGRSIGTSVCWDHLEDDWRGTGLA